MHDQRARCTNFNSAFVSFDADFIFDPLLGPVAELFLTDRRTQQDVTRLGQCVLASSGNSR